MRIVLGAAAALSAAGWVAWRRLPIDAFPDVVLLGIADIQRPLAVVVMGGLVTSTLLTLLVLPAIYALLAGRARAGAAV